MNITSFQHIPYTTTPQSTEIMQNVVCWKQFPENLRWVNYVSSPYGNKIYLNLYIQTAFQLKLWSESPWLCILLSSLLESSLGWDIVPAMEMFGGSTNVCSPIAWLTTKAIDMHKPSPMPFQVRKPREIAHWCSRTLHIPLVSWEARRTHRAPVEAAGAKLPQPPAKGQGFPSLYMTS